MSWVQKGFRAGDWVEVRPIDEILATLDGKAELERLPFMPEMLRHCGRRFRISRAAHKTCDTVHHSGGRRMHDAVHLQGLRCDGAFHGGCQANCLYFWKTGWLRPVAGPAAVSPPPDAGIPAPPPALLAACSTNGDGTIAYSCQATRLYDATAPLSRTRMSQYVADVRSRNVRPLEALKIMLLAGLFNLRHLGIGYRLSVRLYERAHQLVRGRPAPRWRGAIPRGERTPDERLDLQVGELVEVKPVEEILRTLNERGHNRGLSFDPEMIPYCGKRFRVAERVERIISETTGEMLQFSNPCIVLDGVVCKGEYSALRLMCPRQITPYWREIWLRRVTVD